MAGMAAMAVPSFSKGLGLLQGLRIDVCPLGLPPPVVAAAPEVCVFLSRLPGLR